MNYTKKSFTVTQPGTKSYADNWEKTFRPMPGERLCCVVDLNGDACAKRATMDLGDADTEKFFCDVHGETYLKQLHG